MKKDGNPNTPGESLSPTEALAQLPFDDLSQIPAEISPPRAVRYGFRIGDIGFILAAQERAEVIEQVRPCAIPNTPAWFRGMINVRGNLVPVFDLLKLFDGSGKSASCKLITIGQNLKTVALLIDALPETVELTELLDETPALPAALQAHIRKMYSYKDSLWIDVDFDTFFTALGSRLLR